MLDDTPEGFMRRHELRRRDPRAYIAMIDRELADDPDNRNHYFSRHLGWDTLGDLHRALEDIDRSIALGDHPAPRLAAGEILMQLGRYREALAMLARGEAMGTPEQWAGMWGPHYQATCHAHLATMATSTCRPFPIPWSKTAKWGRRPSAPSPPLRGTPKHGRRC